MAALWMASGAKPGTAQRIPAGGDARCLTFKSLRNFSVGAVCGNSLTYAYTRGGRCTMSNFQVFAQLFGRSGLWQFTNQVDTNSADDALLQFIRMGIA
jgi:hypothetical protein